MGTGTRPKSKLNMDDNPSCLEFEQHICHLAKLEGISGEWLNIINSNEFKNSLISDFIDHQKVSGQEAGWWDESGPTREINVEISSSR